jgi:hypothetical protein
LHLKESISLREGRGNTFIMSQKKRRKEIAQSVLETPEKIRELQRSGMCQ